jgi:uncharacterized membrane protein YeaQ/YmgE (transglycosylase-associated protein family)
MGNWGLRPVLFFATFIDGTNRRDYVIFGLDGSRSDCRVHRIVNRRGEGILLDILLGVVGAFAGGWLFHVFGAPGVSGLNLYSLFVAVIGSVVLLVLYHTLRRRRAW